MDKVETAIAEVEREIKRAVFKASAADVEGKPETRSYWRARENELRQDRRQLRAQELLLLERQVLNLRASSDLQSKGVASLQFSLPQLHGLF
ncbi:hypothetical protein WJX84_010525, partial [Apatococcus fuscideae]